LHSPYFPLRGAYSSRDPTVIIAQLSELAAAGVDVAVLSWWGQKDKSYATDTQGVNTDQILSEYLSVADTQAAVKIAFHLEPYPGRSADSVRADIEYIYREYGHHECLLQSPLLKRGEDPAPQSETSGGSGREAGLLFYVYDSYHTDASDWAEILLPANGSNSINKSIRGTLLDSTVIGLWLDSHHGEELLSAGICFDHFFVLFSCP
jgi:glycoprotein endo-alpha-1,2-mannosidase